MSSASLAVVHRAHPRPDRARIAALSAAIALNLSVLLIATRPMLPPEFANSRPLPPPASIRLIEPPPEVPPPPPVEMTPLPNPPVVPVVRTPPVPIAHPPAVTPVVEGNVAAPPASPPTLLPAHDGPGSAVGTAVIETSLAFQAAPLRFPPQAIRQRMHGTVLLRILVDATGRPQQVTVDQSSGHALLDRSAREQVLAGWRFQPAIVNGQAVPAWARVPVHFELRN